MLVYLERAQVGALRDRLARTAGARNVASILEIAPGVLGHDQERHAEAVGVAASPIVRCLGASKAVLLASTAYVRILGGDVIVETSPVVPHDENRGGFSFARRCGCHIAPIVAGVTAARVAIANASTILATQ